VASKTEIYKAVKSSFNDKNPEVKGAVAQCLMQLVTSSQDFAAVPLDGLLTLSLKALEDSSVKVGSVVRWWWWWGGGLGTADVASQHIPSLSASVSFPTPLTTTTTTTPGSTTVCGGNRLLLITLNSWTCLRVKSEEYQGCSWGGKKQ